jgi:hypothetical protein
MLPEDEQNRTSENSARLDIEWLAANALRDALGIAIPGIQPPGFEDTLNIGEQIAPLLFGRNVSLVRRLLADVAVREYQERADAESQLKGLVVDPLDIVDREIKGFEELLAARGEKEQIKRRLRFLRSVRQKLIKEPTSENSILLRDVYQAERPNIPSPPYSDSPNCRWYQLPDGKTLSLYLMHPDRPEQATGADVLYEVYWEDEKLVRLAFVQYKLWDGRSLHLSRARNLAAQIERLIKVTCNGKLCSAGHSAVPPEGYRLPCCSSFIRPTDRLQNKDPRILSKGLHVPVCVAEKLLNEEKVLRRRKLKDRALDSRIFEELFANGITGSRWLPYNRVEQLYGSTYITSLEERVLVHAREVRPKGERG